MTCSSIARDLMDAARGASLPPARAAAVDRHVGECPDCRTRLADERALSAGMRRLSEDTRAPAIECDRESALLAAFDAAWMQPQPRNGWRVAASAAFLGIAATIAWVVVRVPVPQAPAPSAAVVTHDAAASPVPPPVASAPDDQRVARAAPAPAASRRLAARSRKPIEDAVLEPMPFVPWPGSDDLPTFESGRLMRMELPASLIVSIGLTPSSRGDVVQADVLVDQEGYARAVRLVP